LGVARSLCACSAVARARCLFSVALRLVRAAFDPAPAPVLGMADAALAEAAGWPVWASTPKGASATAKPIEAVRLTIVVDSGQYAMQRRSPWPPMALCCRGARWGARRLGERRGPEGPAEEMPEMSPYP
jgi:hypothetical protein